MWEEPGTAEIYLRLGLKWTGIIFAWSSALMFTVGSVLVAFRTRRPGGYWMLAGIVAFFGFLMYDMAEVRTLGFRLEVSVAEIMHRHIGPTLPFFLFGIGFVRLAWSLHRERAAENPQ